MHYIYSSTSARQSEELQVKWVQEVYEFYRLFYRSVRVQLFVLPVYGDDVIEVEVEERWE